MKFVSREDLGWPKGSPATDQPTASGVKIHYEGSHVPAVEHSKCDNRWSEIRQSHLNNPKENYVDVAYNLAVCQHGYVFEGRGAGKRTGANGNQSLNVAHYSILVMIGSSGETEPTAEAISATKEAIRYLRSHGAGKEIKGHRDGYATACPGQPLYDLVKSGKLEPSEEKPTPKPSPIYAPYPGRSFFRIGRRDPLVTSLGKALVKAGYKGYEVGPSPTFSRADVKAVAWFQRKQGWSGADADGYPGPETWKRLKVPKP